jgi:hypothetical protein
MHPARTTHRYLGIPGGIGLVTAFRGWFSMVLWATSWRPDSPHHRWAFGPRSVADADAVPTGGFATRVAARRRKPRRPSTCRPPRPDNSHVNRWTARLLCTITRPHDGKLHSSRRSQS